MNREEMRLNLRAWSSLNCFLLFVYDRTVAIGGQRWEATRDQAQINAAWLIRSGRARVHGRGFDHTARAGEWILTPAVAQTRSFSEDASLLSVRFHANWPDGRPLINLDQPLVFPGHSYPRLARAAKQMERFADRSFHETGTHMEWIQASSVDYLKLNTLFSIWLRELLIVLEDLGISPTLPLQLDDRVIRAVNLINSWPLDQPLPAEQVARQAGLSLVQLNRLFTAQLHRSVAEYFNQRRRDAARRLVEEGRAPLKSAAHELGFKSAAHFSSWFKAAFGKSPRAWAASKERSL
jgi:AraC-like DNA-binding protein